MLRRVPNKIAGATKEKDLRLIFDRISEEILVGARIFRRELEEM